MNLETPTSESLHSNGQAISAPPQLLAPKFSNSGIDADRSIAMDKIDAGLPFDLNDHWRESLQANFLRSLACERGLEFVAALQRVAEKGAERRAHVGLDASSAFPKAQRTLAAAALEATQMGKFDRADMALCIDEYCRSLGNLAPAPFLEIAFDAGRRFRPPVKANWFLEAQTAIFFNDLELAGMHRAESARIIQDFIKGRINRANIYDSRLAACKRHIITRAGQLAFCEEDYDASLEQIFFENKAILAIWIERGTSSDTVLISKRPSALNHRIQELNVPLLCEWLLPQSAKPEPLNDLQAQVTCSDCSHRSLIELSSAISLRFDDFARVAKLGSAPS